MRSFIRVPSEIAIQYSPFSSLGTSPQASDSAITKNLSVFGICFHSKQELPIDTQLVIELQLPSRDAPIKPGGRVTWCDETEDGYDIGVELTWFDGQTDDQLTLARYVNAQPKSAVSKDGW